MLDELIKEIEKKRNEERNEKREAIKQGMIDEMKKHTLRENIEHMIQSLAKIGLERTLLNMLSDSTEIQKAQEMGAIVAFSTICESLKAALDNSLPNECTKISRSI